MDTVQDELRRRWLQMFTALANGEDLSPGRRLRAEGMAEAAVLFGLASEAGLDALMDQCYQDAFGRALADDFGDDWRALAPFPENPAVARRAPVYPSTSD